MSIMTDEVQVTHINVQSPWFECISSVQRLLKDEYTLSHTVRLRWDR
jgi:hypothetical protein